LDGTVSLHVRASFSGHISKLSAPASISLERSARFVGLSYKTSPSDVIIIRLDYCNSLLSGLPSSTVQPRQRVTKSAARVVLALSIHNHVKSALKQLQSNSE